MPKLSPAYISCVPQQRIPHCSFPFNNCGKGHRRASLPSRAMRYPHSFITTLFCLALLLLASADSSVGSIDRRAQHVRPSRTLPADLSPRGVGLTAAQRLARGLPSQDGAQDEQRPRSDRNIRSGGTGRYTGTHQCLRDH
jgi:hypothetical protein